MNKKIKPKISVITTVYNKEQLIRTCIDSVLSQNFTDFEYILVDDESKDNSLQICNDYAAQDPRIKVIHRKNGGHAVARNTGVINAVGNYITFLDGDDYFCDNDALGSMLRAAEESTSDIVVTDFLNVWNEDNKPPKIFSTGIEILEYLLKEDVYHPTPCSRLFKREIFDNNLFKNLISDDEEWTPKAFYHAKRVSIVPMSIYLRTTPDDSVTRITTDENYFRKGMDKALTAGLVLDFFEKENILISQKSIIYKRFVSLYLSSLHIHVNVLKNPKLKNELWQRLEEYKYVLKSSRYYNNPKHHFISWITKYFGLKSAAFLFRIFSY